MIGTSLHNTASRIPSKGLRGEVGWGWKPYRGSLGDRTSAEAGFRGSKVSEDHFLKISLLGYLMNRGDHTPQPANETNFPALAQ